MQANNTLERFVQAQDAYGTYNTALHEMELGEKRSHWIWFVFPQLEGFGRSYNSQYYGLDGLEEAKEYYSHPVLGKRLLEITSALLNHTGKDVVGLMGSHIDAVKLRSCMTLFDAIAPNSVFQQVIDTFFNGRKDQRTLRRIKTE